MCVLELTLQSKQDKKHKKQQAILQELQGAISREVGRTSTCTRSCAPHPVQWAIMTGGSQKYSSHHWQMAYTVLAACCMWATGQGAISSLFSMHLATPCILTVALHWSMPA